MPTPLEPPPYPTDARSLGQKTHVDVFTGGGPGGQHRNKTQTAVRLHHLPSGVVVTASERRSLSANRKAAWQRLIERLERLNRVRRPRKATRPGKRAVERRLTEKSRAARTKAGRRRPADE
jgi:ribosome-associated protein